MPIYANTGTCSKSVTFELDAGVARLAIGRKASDLIGVLKGVPCRNGTSCPDQFARALEAELAKREGPR